MAVLIRILPPNPLLIGSNWLHHIAIDRVEQSSQKIRVLLLLNGIRALRETSHEVMYMRPGRLLLTPSHGNGPSRARI